MTPPNTIRSFFSQLDEEDRDWLVTCCAWPMEGKVPRDHVQADQWLSEFLALSDPSAGKRYFAKVLWLIAMLEFELSPQASSRIEATNQHILDDNSGSDALLASAARALRETIPRHRKIGDRWRELRANELDSRRGCGRPQESSTRCAISVQHVVTMRWPRANSGSGSRPSAEA
jgi:hypothetical protein